MTGTIARSATTYRRCQRCRRWFGSYRPVTSNRPQRAFPARPVADLCLNDCSIDELIQMLVRRALDTGERFDRRLHQLQRLYNTTAEAVFAQRIEAMEQMSSDELRRVMSGDDEPKDTERRIGQAVWSELARASC